MKISAEIRTLVDFCSSPDEAVDAYKQKNHSEPNRPVSLTASFRPAGGSIIPEMCVAIGTEKASSLNIA